MRESLDTKRCRFFFFNDTATTEIYTLSLHDALPICGHSPVSAVKAHRCPATVESSAARMTRSEEHTSELQSRLHLVCRLLLEKKKMQQRAHEHATPRTQIGRAHDTTPVAGKSRLLSS